MFPVLFKIGPLTLHTYGLLVAIGVFVGMRMIITLAALDGYSGKEFEDSLYNLFLLFAISGLAGGRALYVILNWREFVGDLAGIFKVWQGGLVSYGGLLGAFTGFFIWTRKNKNMPWKKICDWFSPSLAFGHALGRLGCLFAGCCYGKPTQGPLGIIFTDPQSLAPLGIPLHPTQIYEFMFLVLLGTFLLRKTINATKSTSRTDGNIFVLYLAFYSAGRFLIEFLRGDDPRVWGLTPGQMASILTFAFSISMRVWLTKKQAIRS